MGRGKISDYIYIIFNRCRQLSLLLAFFFIYSTSFSQIDDLCVETRNKKAIKLYNDAINIINYDYKKGYILLKEAIIIEPDFIEVYYLLGEINYRNALHALSDIHEIQMLERYYSRAEKNFLKVTELCPSYYNYSSYFYLGEFYYDSKDFKKAQFNLLKFTSKSSLQSVEMDKAKAMLENVNIYLDLTENPVFFNPHYVEGICTKADEFLPYISPDGQYAFYTKRYKEMRLKAYVAEDVEEFTYSVRKETVDSLLCVYSKGNKMLLPFNDGRNQGGVSITIDNNHLYITICEFTRVGNKPYNNCDIYVSHLIDGKWSELINLGDSINSNNTWEGQPSISADGNTLYFASAREESIGGIDIYKTEKNKEGKWLKAKGLGLKINTKGNDKSPFIHSDNHTLYFSSDGRLGMGGFDIYFSKLQDNNKWTEPMNIGYPINTNDDDLGFIVSTNGQKAYFSSNKLSGVGGWDIYSFDLYDKARPKKVLFVKGQLVDEKGEILVDAKVELKSITSSKITEGLVDRMTGKYAVAVSVLKNEEFIMTVKKKEYSFTSQYINPYDEEFEEPKEVDFEVKKIEKGTNVKLNNIYFAFNSDSLDNRSKIVLDNFFEFLIENEQLKIRIDGHTDDIDTKEFNLDLSVRRAKAVHDYLKNTGIRKDRLKYTGYGETKPVADNNSDEGRALNRRTEFVILKK